eukprot:jgi/Ulvmu1/1932/UM012_0092.1
MRNQGPPIPLDSEMRDGAAMSTNQACKVPEPNAEAKVMHNTRPKSLKALPIVDKRAVQKVKLPKTKKGWQAIHAEARRRAELYYKLQGMDHIVICNRFQLKSGSNTVRLMPQRVPHLPAKAVQSLASGKH